MSKSNTFSYPQQTSTQVGESSLPLQVLLNIQSDIKEMNGKLHEMEIAQQHFVTKEDHKKDNEKVIAEIAKVSGFVSIVHETQKEIQKNQLNTEQQKENTFEFVRNYLAQETVLTTLQKRLKSMAREARKRLIEDLNFFPNFGKAVIGILAMAGVVIGFIFVFNFLNGTPIQTQPTHVERGN